MNASLLPMLVRMLRCLHFRVAGASTNILQETDECITVTSTRVKQRMQNPHFPLHRQGGKSTHTRSVGITFIIRRQKLRNGTTLTTKFQRKKRSPTAIDV